MRVAYLAQLLTATLLVTRLLAAAPVDAATVTGLTVGVGSQPTVTIMVDGGIDGIKLFSLDDPQRLVVDLAGVAANRRVIEGGGTVTRARIGQFDPATARLVIELTRPMQLAGATLGSDRRLVLTLAPMSDDAFGREIKRGRHSVPIGSDQGAVPDDATRGASYGAGTGADTVPAKGAGDFDLPVDALGPSVSQGPLGPALPPPAASPQPQPQSQPRRGGRRPLVVIDPGHGGKDTGTISVVDSAYEKNVVLAIAKVAVAELDRRGLVRAVLTRSDDTFVPLPGRVAIARAAHADLFVSIHADSAPSADARGASVYTLSDSASDVVAARLAARENKSDIIAGVNLGIDAPDVGDILIDLVQRDTMNVSVNFAETLQKALSDRIGFRSEFHHFAGFRVLKAADIPSVLLETGYLSNVDDAKLLLSKDGQRRIGEGIARAIEAHLARVRPRG